MPGGVNSIASSATGWLDARGADADAVLRVVADVREVVDDFDGLVAQESWTPATDFDPVSSAASRRCSAACPSSAPARATTPASSPTTASARAMLFVRNPTGVSHSPDEWASADDCVAGVEALADVGHGPRRGCA